MSVSIGEGKLVVEDAAVLFDNLITLQGLRRALRDLSGYVDRTRLEHMGTLVSQFRLAPYTAPDGMGIVVTPDYVGARSQEVPLEVELRDSEGDWFRSDSEEDYEGIIQYRQYPYNPYFVGASAETTDEGTFIYNAERSARIEATEVTTLSLAQIEI